MNNLSAAELERLVVLSSRLAEVQKAVGSVLQFGYNVYDPIGDGEAPTGTLLETKIVGCLLAIELLINTGDLNEDFMNQIGETEKENFKRYLYHQ